MAEKFIQSMDLKKGALRKQLGVPESKKIPSSMINKKIKDIQAKEKGGKKLSASDAKLLKRLNLAKTFKSMAKKRAK